MGKGIAAKIKSAGAGQVALTLGVLYPQGLREPAIVGARLGLADAGLDAAAICQRLADGGILAALAGSNQPADIARAWRYATSSRSWSRLQRW